MGLSDEERISKMYWSCYHIGEVVKEIKRYKPEMGLKEDLSHLMALVDGLWPAMVGMESNGLHWLIGSSATSEVRGPSSLWGAAIVNHCYDEREKHNIFHNMNHNSPFNPLDHFLAIEGLLENCRFNGRLFAQIYKLFAITENLTYALRRYNDDFTRKYNSLSDLIAKIQGACFTIFAKHEEFARAYLAGEIFKKMYANEIFKEHAIKNHWQHSFAHIMNDRDITLTQVLDWHRVLYRGSKLKEQDLFCMALEIMGRSYHYDHQFKDLRKFLKEKGFDKVIRKLERQFKRNKKAHEQDESESRENYAENADYEHMSAIHGYDYHNPEKEIMKEREERRKEYEKFINRNED